MKLRCPEGAEVHGRVARLPAAEEALERRVEHDVVELAGVEEAMPAYGGVLRGDALEGTAGEVGGEDDVHDVLPDEGAPGGDRVDDGDRPFERKVVFDPHFLLELAAQGVDEALCGV